MWNVNPLALFLFLWTKVKHFIVSIAQEDVCVKGITRCSESFQCDLRDPGVISNSSRPMWDVG